MTIFELYTTKNSSQQLKASFQHIFEICLVNPSMNISKYVRLNIYNLKSLEKSKNLSIFHA